MPRPLARVSRTKKKHLSIDPSRGQFWKAGSRESAAKGRARECTWRSVAAHTCAYACSVVGAHPSSFPEASPARWRLLSLSSSFSSSLRARTVGIRDMCVPTHAVLVVRTSKGEILMVFGRRAWTCEEGGQRAKDRRTESEGGRSRPDLRCPRPP